MNYIPDLVPYPVPPTMGDDRFRALFDWWYEIVRSGRLPARNDFDPLDFPTLLGRVILIDVMREPEITFRYRLWGTMVTEIIGRDVTGRQLDDLFTVPYASKVHAAFVEIVEKRRPHFWRNEVPGGGHIRSFRRLALPLSSDNSIVDRIIGLVIEDR